MEGSCCAHALAESWNVGVKGNGDGESVSGASATGSDCASVSEVEASPNGALVSRSVHGLEAKPNGALVSELLATLNASWVHHEGNCLGTCHPCQRRVKASVATCGVEERLSGHPWAKESAALCGVAETPIG